MRSDNSGNKAGEKRICLKPLNITCRCGFTLLELLIVMLIMGVAAGLTGIIINSKSGGVEIRKTAREISATLRFARSVAVSEKRIYILAVNNVTMTYGLINKRINENVELESLRLGTDLPKDLWQVKYNREVPELFQIEFTPQGSSSGGVIEIRDDSRQYTISLNRLTGRIRVEKTEL
jgi:general secretion pathway protein H